MPREKTERIRTRPFNAKYYEAKTPEELRILTLAALNLVTCMGARFTARQFISAVRRGSDWIAKNCPKKPESIRLNFKKGTARKG